MAGTPSRNLMSGHCGCNTKQPISQGARQEGDTYWGTELMPNWVSAGRDGVKRRWGHEVARARRTVISRGFCAGCGPSWKVHFEMAPITE